MMPEVHYHESSNANEAEAKTNHEAEAAKQQSADDAKREEAKAQLDLATEEARLGAESLFNINKPKDIRDGLGSGVANMLRGGIGAAALIVSAPVKGAIDGGSNGGGTFGAVKGFGIGLGMGIAGGVTMAVGGAVTGVYQIGRGLINTPTSMSESSKGKDWDSEKGCWIEYNLAEEVNAYLHLSDEDFVKTLQRQTGIKDDSKDANTGENTNQNDAKEAYRPTRTVADTALYEAIGVATNATAAEIKKAYYIKAKQNHPDRHPNDPEAHAKFQKIGHAYQILSDEQLRANYDAGGEQGVENAPKMDSATLFAMIFGSEKFEPLVGELKLATQMQQSDHSNDAAGNNGIYANKLAGFHQRKRELKCASNLVNKLQVFVDSGGDADAFVSSVRDEVNELSSSPFGGTLVATIGHAYLEHAASELSTLDSLSVGLIQAGRSVMTGMSITTEGIRAAMTANEVNKVQKKAERRKSQNDDKATAAAAAAGTAGDDSKAGAASSSSSAGNTNANNSATDAEMKEADAKLTLQEEAFLQKKIEKLSGHMFAVMWYVTEMDIRSTLANVCRKVTHDHSVDEHVRILRCKGMKLFGEYLIKHGKTMSDGLGDIKKRMHEQMGAGGKAGQSKEDEGKEAAATEAAPAKESFTGASSPSSEGNAEAAKPTFTSAASKVGSEADLD